MWAMMVCLFKLVTMQYFLSECQPKTSGQERGVDCSHNVESHHVHSSQFS